MGRIYNNVGWRAPEARQSLGDKHVDLAIATLKKTAMRTVKVMTDYKPSRMETIEMLFRDEDIEAAKRVRGMIRPATSTKDYEVVPGVQLYIDYSECVVPTIENAAMHMHADRIQPLLTYVAEVKAVHDRFEELKAVLKWFNRNATPGAIRAYWPTAMKLTPQSKVWEDLQEVPSRYSEPPHVGEWLQAIRDSAQTFTQSLMLPDDVLAPQRNHMWLNFAQKTVVLGDNASYQTNQMQYNI